MGLNPGTKLGPYEVESLLGAGGMGEVYRARDTRLNRIVAVKILPSHLAHKAEARERFEREARAISALNHPYICHLYDIGEQDGHNYLVMEYLQGETLSSRLIRGRLPFDLALRYGAEIADALEAAHRRGIVHRDLKPGNMFLTAHGECKVLDFGLAKLEEIEVDGDALTAGETAPEMLTTPGSAVGTAAYMSPEQVRGEAVDARTDIFSFGVMLYEMLTGWLPFRGKTSGVVADSILNRSPEPLAGLQSDIPPEMERIVSKALEKDRELRYQSAAELRADLKRLQRDTTGKIATATSGAAPSRPSERPSSSANKRAAPQAGRKTLIASAGLLVVVLIAAALWFHFRQRQVATEPMSFTRLSEEGELVSSANISSDGKYVVYETIDNGKHSLWLRHVATTATVRVVPESEREFETGYDGTTFSPDNNFVYFLHTPKGESHHSLYSVPALGGTPRKVLPKVDSPVTFSPDGKQIAFVVWDLKRSSLIIAAADGSTERVLRSTDNAQQYFSIGGPSWSPDGERIAVIAGHAAAEGFFSDIELIDKSGNTRSLGRIPANERGRVAWMEDGSGILFPGYPSEEVVRWQIFLMSYPEGTISRITNDMDSYGSFSFGVSRDDSALVTTQTSNAYHVWQATASSGYRKAEQIMRAQVSSSEMLNARAGKLVFVQDRPDGASIWVAELKTGSRVQVSDKGWTPRLSPDGKLVAFSAKDSRSQEHLWLVNSDGSGLHQLTTENGDHLPTFSPNGQLIYYVHFTGEPRIYKVPVSGGTPTRVSDMVAIPVDISPDGQSLVIAYPDPKTGNRVWATMTAATGKVLQILPIEGRSAFPVWMPLGDAVAYIATHDGVSNIWKLPLNGGPRSQLTHFDSENILDATITPEGDLVMTRGHSTATVVLIKNFRPQG
jgi:serine/threonine protein kinase